MEEPCRECQMTIEEKTACCGCPEWFKWRELRAYRESEENTKEDNSTDDDGLCRLVLTEDQVDFLIHAINAYVFITDDVLSYDEACDRLVNIIMPITSQLNE